MAIIIIVTIIINMARYNGAKLGTQEPHVFAIAEAAYCHLKSEGVNQSLVISGREIVFWSLQDEIDIDDMILHFW